jgi:hypothetical protein
MGAARTLGHCVLDAEKPTGLGDLTAYSSLREHYSNLPLGGALRNVTVL